MKLAIRRPALSPVLLVVALLAAVLPAGCASPPAGTSATGTSTTPHPVVVAVQAQGILLAVAAAVDASTHAAKAGDLGPRVVGPLQQQEAAQLKLPAALRSTPVGAQSWQRLVVPSQYGWPRWFLAVGSLPSRPTPLLSVLSSSTARVPYGLWAQLAMLPGASLPGTAPVEQGAAAVPPAAGGLLVAPQDVGPQYADLLTRGASSPAAAHFAPDVFRTQVTQQLARDKAAFVRYGTVAARHTAQPGAVLALRTADGGALVIAVLSETYVVKVRASAGTVKVDPTLAALAGKDRFSTQVTRTSQEVVAFVVPAQGSTARVQVVAASKVDLSAVGS